MTMSTDYRITVTIAGYGKDETLAERVLDQLLDQRADVGPVVSQDRDADTLTVTLAVDGDQGATAAAEQGGTIWAAAMAAAELEPTEILALHVDLVVADRELEPA